jgi:hypothetical protein
MNEMLSYMHTEGYMHRRNQFAALAFAGFAILVVSGIALITAQPVEAQCGSQASSCKNCHETQGQDPVNADGTAWHQSHAFGDFCYICHSGNNQAMDETAAHAGMVDPMSDIQAACAQCHPNDLQARADVYASELGVVASLGSAPTAQPSPTPAPAAPAEVAEAAAAASMPSGSQADIVDYVARYDQQVLGKLPTNWGNVILLVMIGALLIGGGGLVISREGLLKVSVRSTERLPDEYPPDVVQMAPAIARLKPGAREALKRLLERPDAIAQVLTSLDNLTQKSAATPAQEGRKSDAPRKDHGS